MSMVNGVWHDTVIGKEKTYGQHLFGYETNSQMVMIVKCVKCHKARMYLKCMDEEKCIPITIR